MAVVTSVSATPAQVSVDMLLGIASSIARLDAKFDVVNARFDAVDVKFAAVQASIAELKSNVASVEGDVRKLFDWKQRLWGMLVLISLITALAPSAWHALAEGLSRVGHAPGALSAPD
ncbi:MAG: hypothetical protein WBW32_14130 [Luteibacter sp.]